MKKLIFCLLIFFSSSFVFAAPLPSSSLNKAFMDYVKIDLEPSLSLKSKPLAYKEIKTKVLSVEIIKEEMKEQKKYSLIKIVIDAQLIHSRYGDYGKGKLIIQAIGETNEKGTILKVRYILAGWKDFIPIDIKDIEV